MKWLRKLWAWIESKKSPAPPKPAPSFPHETVPEVPSTPVESPKGNKDLWVPWAIQPKRKMGTSFTYPKNYPHGAIVHFVAGRDKTEQDAIDSYEWGCDNGFTFFVIGPTGVLYQGFPLNKGGSHAGKSSYPGLGSSVSSKLVGIEISCAGMLDENGKSWFGVKYPENEIRTLKDESWNCPAGKYKKLTKEQEDTLIKLLKWLKNNCPDVFDYDYVLGHSEVSGKKSLGYWRKNDVGGSLSMPMSLLREKLKNGTI